MLVLGHRGTIYDNGVSQNSIKAFQEAVTYGDGFETDAVLSKDGDIFLIHEAKYAHAETGVEYCAGEYMEADSAARLGARRIDQLTSDEVRTLRLKDGQPLPMLHEAIALVGTHPGRVIDIELKGHNIAEPAIDLVKKSVMAGIIKQDAIWMTSSNQAALLTVRQQMPGMICGVIMEEPDLPPASIFPWLPEEKGVYAPLTPEQLRAPLLQKINPDVIIMPESIVTEESAAMIAAVYPTARLGAWVFTERGNFNLPNLLGRLRKFPPGKISAFMPDNPHAFKQAWAPAK